MQIKEKYSWKR